jgi:N-acetylmuramoyl-L-alanine amidase
VSGQPKAQKFRLGRDSKAGSNEPLPQGEYSLGEVEWASGWRGDYSKNWDAGLGPVWIALTPKFNTERSALGLHLDANRTASPGSAGCLTVTTLDDLKTLVGWFDKYKPTKLVCDWQIANKPVDAAKPQEEPKPVPSPSKKRVLLDPGHSEKEAGSRSNHGTAEEEDLNRLQAKIIKTRLNAAGIECDIYDPLVDNLDDIGAKAKGYYLFLSLHHNKFKGETDPGTETFVLPGADANTRKFAQAIQSAVVSALGTTDRGVKETSWQVIRVADQYSTGPAILVESYFLNPYNKAQAEERSAKAAEAISKSVIEKLS